MIKYAVDDTAFTPRKVKCWFSISPIFYCCVKMMIKSYDAIVKCLCSVAMVRIIQTLSVVAMVKGCNTALLLYGGCVMDILLFCK